VSLATQHAQALASARDLHEVIALNSAALEPALKRAYNLSRTAFESAAETNNEIKRTLDEEPVVSHEDVDKARLALLLMRELDVNLAGAEVIVHMREEMVAMQRQFGKILETLIEEIRRAAKS